MQRFYSTRDSARALGTSESTVKRWCDQGIVHAERTNGGHRRIFITELVGLVRFSDIRISNPSVLGLPDIASDGIPSETAVGSLTQSLIEGDEEASRCLLLRCFLSGQPLSEIGDWIIAPVFRQIGQLWQRGTAEVYQERRALEIIRRTLCEIRGLLPAPSATAPLALGATVLGDDFCLPTALVELVLREAGWNASSLGISLPFSAMHTAIRHHRPSLFWISISFLQDADSFVDQYRVFYESVGQGVAVVLGGRALDAATRQRLRYAAYCDNLNHLESFAQTLTGVIHRTTEQTKERANRWFADRTSSDGIRAASQAS